MNLNKSIKVLVTIILTIMWFLLTYQYSSLISVSSVDLVHFNKLTDLIIFLHIEKTGGSKFEDKLLHNLAVRRKKYWNYACKRKSKLYFYCPRNDKLKSTDDIINNWFISRMTVGWTWCGLHADYSQLNTCVEIRKKQYSFLRNAHFITVLRDPTLRYVSEWQHIARSKEKGFFYVNPFYESQNPCNQEVDLANCVPNITIDQELTLEKFTQCKNNIATNRQTRLLAEYTGQNCTLFEEKNKKELVNNAKKVLKQMSFFGLTEYEELSQILFEKTFNNLFKIDYKVVPGKFKTATLNYVKGLNKTFIEKIDAINDLDWELYQYAKVLFFERIKFYKIKS